MEKVLEVRRRGFLKGVALATAELKADFVDEIVLPRLEDLLLNKFGFL